MSDEVQQAELDEMAQERLRSAFYKASRESDKIALVPHPGGGVHDNYNRFHAYIQALDNTLTLIASGPRNFVEKRASDWVKKHEFDQYDRLIFSRVMEWHEPKDYATPLNANH